MGLLETTARDGTACDLLAFHDSEGDPMMVSLTAIGIFGVGEGTNAEGYTSCMLIFRWVSSLLRFHVSRAWASPMSRTAPESTFPWVHLLGYTSSMLMFRWGPAAFLFSFFFPWELFLVLLLAPKQRPVSAGSCSRLLTPHAHTGLRTRSAKGSEKLFTTGKRVNAGHWCRCMTRQCKKCVPTSRKHLG
jgi:hypothetical protein